MNDEILVEYAGSEESRNKYKLTSVRHHDAMSKIAGKVLFDESDLKAFRELGYAVCNNTLDCYGKKVYIYHNIRTFKENK
jgi:hypothetical protein